MERVWPLARDVDAGLADEIPLWSAPVTLQLLLIAQFPTWAWLVSHMRALVFAVGDN